MFAPGTSGAFASPALPPFALLPAGAAFEAVTRILIRPAAVTIDYAGICVVGKWGAEGVASPAHFAERHGLIVIIALGESMVRQASA
ncbi:low temperature requirement protein A [Streptomyces sp. NPDC002787]